MKITPLPRTGTSAKFIITNKRGDFTVSLARTLYEKWGLASEEAQLDVASRMALAIIGRHDPAMPFKDVYVFAAHNTEATAEETITYLHKHEI